MAKKKWKFTDLSDDVEFEQNENLDKNNSVEIDNLDKLKKDSIYENKNVELDLNKTNTILETNNKKVAIEESNLNNYQLNKKIIEKDNVDKELELKTNIEKSNGSEDEYNSKYDIDIDYDSDIPIKEQILLQQQKQKKYTFNETIQMQKKSNISNNNSEFKFDDNKIQQFFTTKEKLDVKTNIYLKPNLVNQILILSKQTGESRSSIINKLIEHALKEIGNK